MLRLLNLHSRAWALQQEKPPQWEVHPPKLQKRPHAAMKTPAQPKLNKWQNVCARREDDSRTLYGSGEKICDMRLIPSVEINHVGPQITLWKSWPIKPRFPNEQKVTGWLATSPPPFAPSTGRRVTLGTRELLQLLQSSVTSQSSTFSWGWQMVVTWIINFFLQYLTARVLEVTGELLSWCS